MVYRISLIFLIVQSGEYLFGDCVFKSLLNYKQFFHFLKSINLHSLKCTFFNTLEVGHMKETLLYVA